MVDAISYLPTSRIHDRCKLPVVKCFRYSVKWCEMDFGRSWPMRRENDYANHYRYLSSMGRTAAHRAGAR
jgi:hypothetical protein